MLTMTFSRGFLFCFATKFLFQSGVTLPDGLGTTLTQFLCHRSDCTLQNNVSKLFVWFTALKSIINPLQSWLLSMHGVFKLTSLKLHAARCSQVCFFFFLRSRLRKKWGLGVPYYPSKTH